MRSFKPQSVRQGVAINGLARAFQGGLSFLILVLIAKVFGADLYADAFLITNALVSLFLLAGENILAVTFVPVFIEYREKRSPEEAQELANSLFTFLFVCLTAVSMTIFFFAPWFARGLAPGFSPTARAVTANLIRMYAPLILLLGAMGMSTSLFYARRSFTIPAITSTFLGMGQLASLFLLGGRIGIYSIPVGAVAGIALQVTALVYTLETKKKGLRFCWNPNHPGMRQVARLLAPRLVGITTARINIIVDRFFASSLEVGFVTALGFAQRLVQIPFMLVMEAMAKTLIPVLSKHDSAGEIQEIRGRLLQVLGVLNAVVIPVMVFFFVLREPLVRLLFERGAFGSGETKITASAFLFYNIGLLAYSYNLTLHAFYYSVQDTATPMKIAGGILVLNFFLDMLFVRVMGLDGIALATSLVAFVRTGFLLAFLNSRIGSLDYFAILKSIARFSLASVPMGIAAWLTTGSVGRHINISNPLGLILQMGAAIAVGGLVYAGMYYYMMGTRGSFRTT